jgi:hypothetical protein
VQQVDQVKQVQQVQPVDHWWLRLHLLLPATPALHLQDLVPQLILQAQMTPTKKWLLSMAKENVREKTSCSQTTYLMWVENTCYFSITFLLIKVVAILIITKVFT